MRRKELSILHIITTQIRGDDVTRYRQASSRSRRITTRYAIDSRKVSVDADIGWSHATPRTGQCLGAAPIRPRCAGGSRYAALPRNQGRRYSLKRKVNIGWRKPRRTLGPPAGRKGGGACPSPRCGVWWPYLPENRGARLDSAASSFLNGLVDWPLAELRCYAGVSLASVLRARPVRPAAWRTKASPLP